MMLKFSILSVGALLLMLTGCEEPVDLASLQVKDQIVVDSRLHSGITPQVTLLLYDGFGDSKVDLAGVLVSSAVELKILGTDTTFLLDTLPITQADIAVNGDTVGRSFRVPEYKVKSGVRYQLKVSTPGYPVLSSTTIVPQGAEVKELSLKALRELRSTVDTTEELPLAFDLNDVPGVENFYHVIVRIGERSAKNVGKQGGLPTIYTRVSLVDEQSGRIDVSEQGVLFTDAEFADRTTRILATLPTSLVAAYTDPRAIIEVRTVSREYYRFYSQRYRTGDDLFPGTIAGGYDNISGGTGLFGAFSDPPKEILVRLR